MAKIIFAKSGNTVKRKFRCTTGKKRGRIVATPSACFSPVNLQKKFRMKQLHRTKGALIQRRAQITKRTNPTSRRIATMNKSASGSKKR